jgi:hypothetical protein
MHPTLRTLLLPVLAFAASAGAGLAQDKLAEIARAYNQGVQPIYDQIDDLRRRANDPSLSMDESARLIDQQSSLRRDADQLWKSTQGDVDSAYRRTGRAIDGYNADNRRLDFESAIVGTQIDLLKNVGNSATKEEFEQKKAQFSQQWEQTYGSRLRPFGDDFDTMKKDLFGRVKDAYGVDLEQTGYSRIGTINPYTGETYYKYYGPDGNLVGGQWKDDADGWSKWRDDVAASYRRQRDLQQQLQADASDLAQSNDRLERARQATNSKLADLQNRVRRVDFAGNWQGYDNVGNWIRLRLSRDGTMRWSWGKTSTTYSSSGDWQQSGQRISMRTSDGQWRLFSTITEQFRLEFIEVNSSGGRYTEYLTR